MFDFEEDRQIEKEISAIITYFKLLKQIELTQKEGFPIFELIGGIDTLNSLVNASKEGIFDCRQKNGDLLQKLADNLEYVKRVTFSKGPLVEKEILYGQIVQAFSSSINKDQMAVMTLLHSTTKLPSSLIMPSIEEMMNSNQKQTVVQKKIGER